MATKIVTKNSSTAGSAPSASDLVQGELAVNVVDKRLYTENNSGAVVELGTNPAGAVTMASTLAVTGNVDFNGDLDVDGTTNLDVVDIDGAVDMASTLQVDGAATFTTEITANGGIALGDNDKATFGASDDLQIYHAGSHSIINDSGTGDLRIGGSTNVQIWNAATSKLSANFNADSAATLYNNGGAKLATTATGIDVTGNVTSAGLSSTSTGRYHYIQNAAGNQTFPSYSFQGDSNTGMMSDAADTLSLVTGGATRVKIDSSGRVGIGTNLPDESLEVNGDAKISGADSGNAGVLHFGGVSDDVKIAGFDSNSGTANSMLFYTNSAERMRIDSSGNVLVGKDTDAFGTAGIVMRQLGIINITRASGSVLNCNRTGSDGALVEFHKDGTTVGSIGTFFENSLSRLYITQGDTGLKFNNSPDIIVPCTSTGANRDNAIDLGASSARFNDIYATNGTIQTSDAREKTEVRELTDAEMRVAKKLSKNIGFFQWLTAIEKKGADARSHCGQTVQGVIAEFDAEGLDAFDYAMVCYNEWEDEFTEHPAIEAVEAVEAVEGVEAVEAVEAVDAVLDEDGEIVSEAVEAVEAIEGVDAVEAVEAVEAVDAWTEQTQEQGDRFSLRTDQLNHFMIRGLAQSQEELEARLSALEA